MLNEQNCIFSKNRNGFLQAEIDGVAVGRVKIVCAQPLHCPHEYLSVMSMDDKEHGIIEKLTDFSEAQQAFIKGEIAERYFCPVLSEINSIKDKMGNFFFDVVIDGHKKNFAVRDLTKSIRQQGNAVTITDVDGNRYAIQDISKIGRKSRRMLEPYLY